MLLKTGSFFESKNLLISPKDLVQLLAYFVSSYFNLRSSNHTFVNNFGILNEVLMFHFTNLGTNPTIVGGFSKLETLIPSFFSFIKV